MSYAKRRAKLIEAAKLRMDRSAVEVQTEAIARENILAANAGKPDNAPLLSDGYGHMVEFPTDPYGNLEWCVGSADDFVCFDYNADTLRRVIAIHSVINSETGSFIEDHAYNCIDGRSQTYSAWAEEVLDCTVMHVGYAVDWACEHGIAHDKAGWSQDHQYFLRQVCCVVLDVPEHDGLRYGSTKFNKLIRGRCEEIGVTCPRLIVSRKPKLKK